MKKDYVIVKYNWMDNLLNLDSIDEKTKHKIVYQIISYLMYKELPFKGDPIIDAFTINIIKEIDEDEKMLDDINSYSVYGMYRNGELIYVGMTMRNFKQRWKEHQGYIKNKSHAL